MTVDVTKVRDSFVTTAMKYISSNYWYGANTGRYKLELLQDHVRWVLANSTCSTKDEAALLCAIGTRYAV